MKCGIDEARKLVQDSHGEKISIKSFDRALQQSD